MASFKKYRKKTTVVGVNQITSSTAGDYGDLGTLASGEYIVYLADGTIVTLDNLDKYELVSDNTALTGDDWD